MKIRSTLLLSIAGMALSLSGCTPPPPPTLPPAAAFKSPRAMHEHNVREAERQHNHWENQRSGSGSYSSGYSSGY